MAKAKVVPVGVERRTQTEMLYEVNGTWWYLRWEKGWRYPAAASFVSGRGTRRAAGHVDFEVGGEDETNRSI